MYICIHTHTHKYTYVNKPSSITIEIKHCIYYTNITELVFIGESENYLFLLRTFCPHRQQLWKAVITEDNGYKTQHSYPRSRLITLKKARGEIWLKRSEKKQQKENYQDEDKMSAMIKKKNY